MFCSKLAKCDIESWLKVERLYRSGKLYNLVIMRWLKVTSVLLLSSTSAAITLLLYATITASGLPMLIHCWLPIIAGVTISLTTWIFLDAVWAKRAADEVLENLQSRTEDCYGRLPLTERKELVRRARALQPLYLGLGNFTELSFDVIISVWDEVLNQLLFLLSL